MMHRYTIEQIACACRHVDELVALGLRENMAIRTLELLVNVHAKCLAGYPPAPDHANQFKLWSTEAMKIMDMTPQERRGRLRVEHGTPRRLFARLVMNLHKENNLNEHSLVELVAKRWRVAIITVEEDARLSQLGLRSESFDDPYERWRRAGIAFPGGLP